MLFFKKKRKKNNNELDAAFERLDAEIKSISDDNPKKIKYYILDSCEHIIATTKEIESQKSECRTISDYLEDIDKILSMDKFVKSQLVELVENIEKLTKRKKAFHESEKRLSDETFFLMHEREDSVVGDIRRLEENEKYRSKVDNEVKYLEAEKSRFEMDKDHYFSLSSKMRMLSIILSLMVIGILVIGLMLLRDSDASARLPFIILVFCGVLCAALCFLATGNFKRKYRRALKRLNQCIGLLNVERMRYANVSKAINYERGVYDVRSAAELSYIWEQYMMTVRERENYRKNNIDLAYYVDKMYKLFKSLDLRFERHWLERVDTMLDPDALPEMRIRLRERYENVTKQITVNNAMIKSEREEIDRMMRDYDYYVPEVMEIISSVDKIMGVSAQGNMKSA